MTYFNSYVAIVLQEIEENLVMKSLNITFRIEIAIVSFVRLI